MIIKNYHFISLSVFVSAISSSRGSSLRGAKDGDGKLGHSSGGKGTNMFV